MKTCAADRLLEWERTMRTGTDAARCGQALLAEDLYLRALALARALLDHPPAGEDRADDRVAAFVVSHLSLADFHAEAEHPSIAAAYLCAAHRALMTLLRDPQAAHPVQQAALRHSRETHAALLEHLAQHGNADSVLAALRAGCMPFTPGALRHGPTLH